MKSVPPQDEWISMRQAAKVLGCSYSTVHLLAKKGKKSRFGEITTLSTWRTGGGKVTTLRECEVFLDKLNA